MNWTDFSRSEEGSAGAWSLLVFLVCAVAAGVSVDGTNGVRAKEHLQSTADMAAHAGLMELINGGTDSSIRNAVSANVQTNMPTSNYGNVLGDTSTYVSVGHFADGTLASSLVEDDNAVSVELHMSSSFGNAVKTFLLGFVGLDSMDVIATSTAVMEQSDTCIGYDGIYAHGQIKMTSTSTIGAGFCIFSKSDVDLSNHNVFEPGSGIGMPDLANCSHCDDASNPGVEDAQFEANLQLEDVGAHVDNVMSSLLGTGSDSAPYNDFLDSVVFTDSLTPLADLGYNINKMRKGSIVSIEAGYFQSMDTVPGGLIYAVNCGAELNASGAITRSPSASKKDSDIKANLKTISLETPSGSTISDAAIVTDCKVNFGNTAQVVNSIIATSSTSVQSISASSYAKIGSGGLVCPSTEKVVVLTKGDLNVPAGMETNNVDFYVEGDASLASGTSGQATKLGTSFYVGGTMSISAQGDWFPCGGEDDSLALGVDAIRHVIASVE
ncbi:Tad domain-containing protein [Aliiruegeria sabulilitoris]|uniref:Tad domain-containing protein n=1 Tax=Aliiruegeria sabulilitoris TaxID=1510458 RepID=UPI00082E9AD4|nr:Tad domain-containing protein [Aliiruegeria sabulilitoris]NDR55912.1 hypothetical protein [Pseudoruegeria sp. M32A2M]